ncbi:uncharacterized protein B0I36DRAFT_254775 [Microdochium trichocladiopsis]|uniref:Arylamine N-acetyltransferase n=1 Tax=Microdochium trichocladiopsis TaxID=1682393 RepID=A0A9P8XTU5_9PEZI|nr:uncharacterized protein B0I36DRAFT_254775 [Microdochium trichocladiopsis]KAH7016428.1 hypothetical protein B0I36DRAFT_254775 [Microdochium trichocladiopsis]
MADRPTYNKGQLAEYFARIALPESRWEYSVVERPDDEKLTYLTDLLKHHVVKVPFENLTLHYSWHKVIDTKPQHLFNKMVRQPARGGYCLENNSLFHTVLLSLGFSVYLVGARVYNPGTKKYGGFSHCANIVTIGDTRYMVDVGYGPNQPARPIPLLPGVEQAHVGQSQMRVIWDSIPQNLNQESKLWIYQHRIDAGAEWVPNYCFVDVEFLLEDIRGMNMSPWRSPTSFFTYRILITRFTTSHEVDGADGPESPGVKAVSEGELDGAIILNHDSLKWRRNGKTVLEQKLKAEKDRLEALRRYFGIVFPDEDQEAILSTASELKDSGVEV